LREILPVAWHYDTLDDTPLPVLRKAWEAGIMNADIPTQYGGKGFGLVENVLITEELAAACAGLATSIFDNSLGMEPLRLSTNIELKKKYFTEIAQNFKLICFATSEPTMGSDVSGIRCLAQRDGEDYILNGTKYWITNGGWPTTCLFSPPSIPQRSTRGSARSSLKKTGRGFRSGAAFQARTARIEHGGHSPQRRPVPKENVLAPPGEGFVLAMKTFARTGRRSGLLP